MIGRGEAVWGEMRKSVLSHSLQLIGGPLEGDGWGQGSHTSDTQDRKANLQMARKQHVTQSPSTS